MSWTMRTLTPDASSGTGNKQFEQLIEQPPFLDFDLLLGQKIMARTVPLYAFARLFRTALDSYLTVESAPPKRRCTVRASATLAKPTIARPGMPPPMKSWQDMTVSI